MIEARRDGFLRQIGQKPLVMGILNVTPDSFSDGGRFAARDAALAQAARMEREGADILDIGAESTRPGAAPVSAQEEIARIEAVLPAMRAASALPISIDTYKAAVARRAMDLGASMVNDVWGLQADPGMAAAVAETGGALVIMHNRREIDAGIDILSDIRRFFDASLELAARENIPRGRMLLDPGIGFGKTQAQNLLALNRLGELRDYGLPILVGVSRKSLIGAVLDAPVGERLIGSISAHLAGAARGAHVFRVHDVAEHVAAFKVFEAIRHERL